MKYPTNTNWPWIMGMVRPCSIAGMAKRSVLYAIKLPRLVEGDEYT